MVENKILFLFDVDGTLTHPRKKISKEVLDFLNQLKQQENIFISFVGGSNLSKQIEQINSEVLDLFDFSFPENGLEAYRGTSLINQESILDFFGNENYKNFVNFCLEYLAKLDIPVKRGTFIEFRSGLINISPIGRNCSQEERDNFEVFDLKNNIRLDMIKSLKLNFPHLNLQYVIGGQISFDVFPKGWDKTFCLNYLENEGFKKIYFFGDKTFEGGNDFEIFNDSRVIGNSVKSPSETISKVKFILKKEYNLEL